MPDLRAARSWLASRHLRDSSEGAGALAALEALDPAERDRLLSRGDILAEQSVGLAHVFFTAAVSALRSLGDAYPRWEATGLQILGDSGNGRDAAQSYFKLDPGRVESIDAATREVWLRSVHDLLASSRRLGNRFVEASGPVLCANPDIDAARVRAWHANAAAILERGGWRGEFLASALVESMPALLALLNPDAVDAWSALLRACGSSGRSPRTPRPPEDLAAIEERMRTRVLQLCTAIAEVDPRDGGRMLETLPGAVVALPSAAAGRLADALQSGGKIEEIAETLTMVPALIHGIAPDDVDALYAHLPGLAAGFPAAVVPYLRTMDRAFEEGGLDGVALWVARGMEIAARNEHAGMAHFRLESRTSHKILVQHSTAVSFEEVEALLQRYVVMMSRRSFQFLPSAGIWYRPMLTAPEDPALRLPERIDLCRTSEENQLLYKLTVAHIAGRWEYGTYDFLCDEFAARGCSLPEPPEGAEREREDLLGLIDSFPNPLLAAALFVLLDGARVDACLERDFPGLRADLDRMGRFYAANPVPAAQDRYSERLLEALFMMSVGRLCAAELEPRLQAQGERLSATLELLRAPEASVYDSAALLLSYYGSLQFAYAAIEEQDPDAMFGDLGGATVIDPFDHLEGDGSPFAGAAAQDGAEERSGRDPGKLDAELQLELEQGKDAPPGPGTPMSAEELRRLLEAGVKIELLEQHGEVDEGLGLYITDLLGKLPADVIEELRSKLACGDNAGVRAWLTTRSAGDHYFYDEWDYAIHDYRRRWCRLYEVDCGADSGEYFHRVLSRSEELISRIRHGFQTMRPEQFVKVRRMRDGEDFDLNALVEAHADRRTRQTPTERVYVARRREERDVATLFLVDMSASTDEPLRGDPQVQPEGRPRRVIDLFKDTLAVMAQVLEEIGDAYAVYGFSGHGRENVEYYRVKSFAERLSDHVKSRLGGIEPKRSTRMGAALRHSSEKLARVSARSKHLILLSDGFPQDFDYGEDRRSNVYGIRDTMTALQEIERQGVRSFCITVDPAGHDYLRDMCPASQYAVIADIAELPEELPRIYRQITRV